MKILISKSSFHKQSKIPTIYIYIFKEEHFKIKPLQSPLLPFICVNYSAINFRIKNINKNSLRSAKCKMRIKHLEHKAYASYVL